MHNYFNMLKDVEDLTDWFRKNKKVALEIISELQTKYPTIPRNYRDATPFRQAVWHILNNSYEPEQCTNPDCTNLVKWHDTTGYQRFCGAKCSCTNPQVIAKKQATCIDRHGVDNIFKDVEKMTQARIDALGYAHAMQSPTIKQNAKNTCIEKYGDTHPWKNKEIRSKCVDSRHYQYVSDYAKSVLTDKSQLEELLVTQHLTQEQVAKNIGVTGSTVCLYAASHNIVNTIRSKVQSQLHSFITDHYDGEIKYNNKTLIPPFEVDIIIPDLKLGIELDGVYWHGELQGKTKQYHLNKTNQCTAKGYQLLHIFDSEWNNKTDIVKSRILSILNKTNRIHARKCTIQQITSAEERKFLSTTHIQGYVPSTIAYGLYHNDELVGCMSFINSRYDKNVDFELLRFSNKLNTTIVGGASKLLSHFNKTHNSPSIISYCDLRWGTGAVYQKMGFTQLSQTPPNYYYFKRNAGSQIVLESRIKYQKHKLSSILEVYSETDSEWINMQNNGFDRIWDCGNSKWGLNIQSCSSFELPL